jgi:uncharacterized protein (DUF736 family)
MATIGTFTKTANGDITGTVKTLISRARRSRPGRA